LSKEVEEQILLEITKDQSQCIEQRLLYFTQLCSRLGLKEERIEEITPKMKALFEKNKKNLH
jgi:thiaminase